TPSGPAGQPSGGPDPQRPVAVFVDHPDVVVRQAVPLGPGLDPATLQAAEAFGGAEPEIASPVLEDRPHLVVGEPLGGREAGDLAPPQPDEPAVAGTDPQAPRAVPVDRPDVRQLAAQGQGGEGHIAQ